MSAQEPEDLRDYLREQFARIDEHFARVDEHFARVDRYLLRHDDRFDALDRRVDNLQREMVSHFDQIYHQLERLEVEYVAITQAIRRFEGALADERTRREALEERARELRAQIASLEARLDQIERQLSE